LASGPCVPPRSQGTGKGKVASSSRVRPVLGGSTNGGPLHPNSFLDLTIAIHELTLAYTRAYAVRLRLQSERLSLRKSAGPLAKRPWAAPRSREGTMSITLPDPAAHLLDLLTPQVGPPGVKSPETREVTTEARRRHE
jgi:hypothetical protein